MKFNGRNIFISPSAQIGSNVQLGDNVAIYDNVELGDNTIVCNDSVIGEPIAAYYSDPDYNNPPTKLGSNCLVRSHSVIYSGCIIGDNLSTGHHVSIRERTIMGNNCSVGTFSDIQGDVNIGDFSRIHSHVHIGEYWKIADFVFVYPYSVFTNDPYPPSEEIQGGCIESYTQIAVHSILLPGVVVGEHCLVGANSVVTRRMPSYSLIQGNPAKVVRDIRKIKAIRKGQLYPWPKRFSRGMPWQEDGYDSWFAANQVVNKK